MDGVQPYMLVSRSGYPFATPAHDEARMCLPSAESLRQKRWTARSRHNTDATAKMPVQLVTIDGNIGTGKSTLANHVAQYMPTMRFFASPEHEGENPHWAAFVANPAKHALSMQCWLLRARLRVYLQALRHMEEARESVILDFSIWSDLIFATKHFEDGNLTAAEFERYQTLAREIYALELPPPHLSIVLQATPEICLQRRSRLNMPLPRRPRGRHRSRSPPAWPRRPDRP